MYRSVTAFFTCEDKDIFNAKSAIALVRRETCRLVMSNTIE
jgi:hypothetical protein